MSDLDFFRQLESYFEARFFRGHERSPSFTEGRLEAAVQAIALAWAGRSGATILLRNGQTITAQEVVEDLQLQAFVADFWPSLRPDSEERRGDR